MRRIIYWIYAFVTADVDICDGSSRSVTDKLHRVLNVRSSSSHQPHEQVRPWTSQVLDADLHRLDVVDRVWFTDVSTTERRCIW